MSFDLVRGESKESEGQEPIDEVSLIALAKAGDRWASGELYRRHVSGIYRYIYARVRDRAMAEDLTSETFVQALQALPRYQPTGAPFRVWLYRIASARIVDHWRRQGRRPEAKLSDLLPAEGPSPEEAVFAEAQWLMALELLAQLTDDQQDVLILRFIGEMTLAEVAETLGKSLSAVKSLQHRALATLARLRGRREAVVGDRNRPRP